MISRKLTVTIKLVAFIFLLSLSTGCHFHHFTQHHAGAGSEDNGDNGGGEGTNQDGSGTVDNGGGTVHDGNGQGDFDGVRVVVPPGAVDEGKTVTIVIEYMNGLPGPVAGNVTPLSDGISITKDDPDKFNIPVTVYIPYDGKLVDKDDILGVFYWDQGAKKYVAVGVKEIDTTHNVISFTTAQLGQYVVLTIKGLTRDLPAVDSGFTPCDDGFFHPDFGSYDNPGSSSFAMASFSEWYYSLQKGADGTDLYTMYRSGEPARWEDDVTARELISRAYADASGIWAILWSEPDYKLDDKQTGELLVLAMSITGSPQMLVLTSENYGRTVTVCKYDKPNGTFTIYDSSFPCEAVTLKWDGADGFSSYSKAASFPGIQKCSFESYLTAYGTDELKDLYNGAQSGWDKSKFQTITITSPALDASSTAIVCSSRNVTVTGKVGGGIQKARYLVYNINGTDGLGGELVTLADDGTFSFTIADLPRATNSIMVMTSDNADDAAGRVPSAYAGFKEFTIKVEGKTHFFQNPGFETGDFTAWSKETRYLCSNDPAKHDRCSIQTVGTDPIFHGLQRVYRGCYSARVNDISGDKHISSVWQTAVVPVNVAFPEIRFYWAAVLEDSDWQCKGVERPYVEVLVYDQTANTELYHKVFTPDDPTYSGWEGVTPLTKCSGFDWISIPWQTVVVDCAGVKGHSVTLKVTAADSSKNAHGGYLYLDGDE
jgi:hypothetical protein